jgi:F0F1-type ATP synthase membrane subunit c/vacuolar-type H+-ATPase subunit K
LAGATMMIVLQALPEIIVLLGFVTSLLIVNAAG